MFATSAVAKWKKLLTPEAFLKRRNALCLLHSEQTKGENNPMFGQPSPNGSGRGRSGTWHNVHFRSLLEFTFLVWFNNRHGYIPQSAEKKEFSVSLPSGKTYFPDFIDRDGFIYEIKPSRMLILNTEKLVSGKIRYGAKFIVLTEKDLPEYKLIHTRLDEFTELKMNRD